MLIRFVWNAAAAFSYVSAGASLMAHNFAAALFAVAFAIVCICVAQE